MFNIQTPLGFVFGFNSPMQIMVDTTDVTEAKVFQTEKAAQKFINRYSDCGYGMSAGTCTIVPLPMLTERELNELHGV